MKKEFLLFLLVSMGIQIFSMEQPVSLLSGSKRVRDIIDLDSTSSSGSAEIYDYSSDDDNEIIITMPKYSAHQRTVFKQIAPLVLPVLRANSIDNENYLKFNSACKKYPFLLSFTPYDAWLYSEYAKDKETELSKFFNGPDMAAINRIKDRDMLHWAAVMNADKIIPQLILMGMHIDSQELTTGSTALHLAAWKSNAESVKILIQAGANLEAKDVKGFTPLHLAVNRNNLITAEILLEASANLDTKNNDGKTPKDLVKSREMHEIICLNKLHRGLQSMVNSLCKQHDDASM